jgi:acetyl esterase/lipase
MAGGLAAGVVAPTAVAKEASVTRKPGDIVLTDRVISVPNSISPAAQKVLTDFAGRGGAGGALPETGDKEGWRRHIAQRNDQTVKLIYSDVDALPGVTTRQERLGEIPVFVSAPEGVGPDAGMILLDIHGGALVYLAGEGCRLSGRLTASRFQLHTVSVDYRVPPDHPYPAALDDCVAAYRALLNRAPASRIVIGGPSAGANLAAATILRARDEGLPAPAGALLITPELDLTESGDSFQVLRHIDVKLPGGTAPFNRLYANGHDLAHPYLSPLFADFAKGFAPTLLQAGTRDLFLSNAVRMHRKLRTAGVRAELHVFEAMPHGGFGRTPEDDELAAEVRRFVASLAA